MTTTKRKRAARKSGAVCSQLDIADIKWEYEDELPGMEDDEYDRIFPSSRIIGNEFGGVRMYPYVEIGGARIWIAGLANTVISETARNLD